ncbi:MAG: hypothetical protein C5B55_10285 [Blastocatellia bacterium]|nr:MAG: hypothetical protein C5B55_10285 [Blastocatellia bacterium]
MTLLRDSTISHYRIVSKLGAGGMGEVFLAQDTSELGRKVALKILPAEVAKNQNRLQRFIQEARTVSNLNHPNILTIHEFGQADSASFIAAEFVDGVTLRKHLANRRLKLVDVLDVAIQIVAALNAAHEAGVTHRDLKPENVMVRKDQIVKVLDFGLAKLSETVTQATDPDAETRLRLQTEPGLVMGTVSYMSPEQSTGHGVDQRTDIWSFGVLLYEMLAGELPFQGKDVHRQIIAIQESEPQPLSKLVNGVPERLEEIVEKCLAKDKHERYQTAKDLLIDLRNLRRKLDIDAEIERTVAPGQRTTSAAGSQSQRADGATTASAAQIRPTSSAEYLVAGLKQHKLTATIVVLVLILAGVGTALFLHARNTEATIDSIAVVPFMNQNRDPESEYLSDGLTESIINKLIQLPLLRVSPRSSVFHYKGKDTDPIQIGKELGVRAVLTGRLMQRGDNLIISTELLDVRDNKQIWGEQYNRKVSDALAVQQEIAHEITDRLRLKLSGEEQKQMMRGDTTNTESYQSYLRGRYYWNKRTGDNLRKAITEFQKAADTDPNYALAYVGLADAYVLLEDYAGARTSETCDKSKAFAERALQLDPSLAEAHASLAYTYTQLWEWDKAEAEFKRSLELNPNYASAHQWYSLHLRIVGRPEDSLREAKRALATEPLSLINNVSVGQSSLAVGDNDAAIEAGKRTIDLDPNFPRGHEELGLAYLAKKLYYEGLNEFRKAVEVSGRGRRSLSFLGYTLATTGKRDEAMPILKELQDKYEKHEALAQDVAAVYLGLGDKEQAFVWLEKGFQDRSGQLARTRWESPFYSVRNDPRLFDLFRRMGLRV